MNDFHKFRQLGIGGSDVAAVIGRSKYATPLDVYHSKMPDYIPKEIENESCRWGKLLEPIILARYTEKTGMPLQYNVRVVDKKYSCLRANLDGWHESPRVLVETKNSAHWNEWGEEGSDDMPTQYICQVAHCARITNAEEIYIPVLLHGHDFRIYRYYRHETLEEELKELCIKFWQDHVLKRIPPDPISGDDVQKYIKCITGKTVIATKEIKRLAHELQDVKIEYKESNDKKKEIEGKIKLWMRENESVIDLENEGKELIKYGSHIRKSVDLEKTKNKIYKETCVRRLLVKKVA